MKTKYIFIDIDGTLFSHTTGIPKSALEAIDLARKNGHKAFINTGRVSSAVDDYLKFYPFDGYVYGAGSHVVIKEEDIFLNIIEEAKVKEAVTLFEKLKIGYVLEGSDFSYYNDQAIEFFKNLEIRFDTKNRPEVLRHLIQENMVYPISDYLKNPTPITKFSIFTKSFDELLEVQRQFQDGFDFIKYKTSAEIVVKGQNKATGIEKVLDYYGADFSDAIALGDSMNDYDMIKQAGIGIAMGNAVEEIKSIADFTTFHIDDHGLYHAFKVYKLID